MTDYIIGFFIVLSLIIGMFLGAALTPKDKGIENSASIYRDCMSRVMNMDWCVHMSNYQSLTN